MQHEGELRSDIDYVIDVLRSNPTTKFTVAKLRSCTGLPIAFLKKWLGVLEEEGHIRFFYNIPEDEFCWVLGSNSAHIGRNIGSASKAKPGPVHGGDGKKFRQYDAGQMQALLSDIGGAIEEAKKLDGRVSAIKKSRVVDLAALGIARHGLAEKNKELAHLLSEAKRLKGQK
ncbi:MAG: hypothetical protein V1822_04040 [Candidatus Micrarchaeota archaeon]